MAITGSPTKRQQVIDAISANITNGKLAPGTRLSSVRDMSAHFDVSLSVIQGAMKELIEDGMIECRGNNGFYVKEQAATAPAGPRRARQKDTGPILFCCHHHSDLTWRRSYEGYAAIREKQIDMFLSYFEKHRELQVFFDQSEVIRMYLEKHPEKTGTFKQLVEDGKIELLGGMSIPDLNMCNGESLVRNLNFGRDYYNDTFGVKPQIASMIDAFGLCAQLPQVLRQSGYSYLVPGRLANKTPEIPDNRPFTWKGLDGSDIPVTAFSGFVSHGGYEFNVPVSYPSHVRLGQSILALKQLEGPAMASYMTEEELIDEDIFWVLETVNKLGGRLVEFGKILDYCEKLDIPSLPETSGEFNPTFTGCYTTRIGIKQLVRKAENSLQSAEFLSALTGRTFDSDPLWKELILSQFHDGICGCHTDEVTEIINQKLGKAISGCKKFIDSEAEKVSGNGLTIINTDNISTQQLLSCTMPEDVSPENIASQRDGDKVFFVSEAAPCGISGIRTQNKKTKSPQIFKDLKDYKFETDFFMVEFHGAEPVIQSKILKHNIFAPKGFGEILFRADYGSMWTEALQQNYHGNKFQSSEICEVADGDVFVKVVTGGHVLAGEEEPGNIGQYWPGFGSLSFTKEFIFPKKLDYFKMKITLDWKGTNTKISVRFPLDINIKESFATYEIPFGSIIRKPYFEVPYDYEETARKLNSGAYKDAHGDWPALNWVDYADGEGAIAVANTGTPGHQLSAGNIFVSLLRSPTLRADGAMVPQQGAYDNGQHTYEFAFRPHLPGESEKAIELGRILNQKPLVIYSEKKAKTVDASSIMKWNAGNIALSSLRKNDDGTLTLRLYESLGRTTEIELSSRRGNFESEETDFEELEFEAVEKNRLKFHPFEIKTLRIKFSG